MWRIALALVVFLAACAKDDGSKVIKILQGVDIAARVSSIVLQSDTLIVSDVFSVDGDKTTLTRYNCTGQTCTRSPTDSAPKIEPLRALAGLTVDPRTTYTKPGKHQGVDVAQYSLTSTRGGDEWTFSNYGAWLTYSGLETSIGNATSAGGTNLQTAYSMSFGNDTGTSPGGNATWTGVMIGNTRHGQIEPIRGDANVAFTLGENPALEANAVGSLDVRFVNIKNPDTGNAHPDMPWPPVSVFADGSFRFEGNGQVAGRFYGPDHGEVGGVFNHPTALGAFGARKN